MLKAFLGNDENSPSKFTVSGLPPLVLKTGRNGYFDGFVVLAAGMDQISLTPSFDNRMAITAAATIAKQQPMSTVQKGCNVEKDYSLPTAGWLSSNWKCYLSLVAVCSY
ncbi:hypothetical protein GCK32_020751 [Trichostrongylus colubriformis]|uniref:Uncharacterized protein n=1 Tax=Trichostrongylus colubriformis TaxID=6319 RepID=A0AAN8GAN1_TRICO